MSHKGNSFTFAMELAKAFGESDDTGNVTRMTIKGVASNTRRDKDNHQMTVEGLNSIQKSIEDGIVDDDGEWDFVPLRSGHRSEWEDKLGSITKAEIDDNENLWITAELDPDSSKARDLFKKVSKGNAVGRKPQLGLSVKGQATKYHFGIDPETQTRVTYLDNVTIEEVSVTSKPKNPTPYPLAIAKSLTYPEDTQTMEAPMENENTTTDPIAQAVQKAEEARNEPQIQYTDGTEQQAAAQPNAEANTAPDQNANPTTAEAEALAAEQADAANHERTEGVAATVPAGYAAHPQTAAATQAQEQDVQTQPATQPEAAGTSVTQQEILRQLDELRALVEKMQGVEVQKAESHETPATSVSLDDTRVAEIVALAVKKALDDSKVIDELAVVKGAVEALQNLPEDKSIAVSKAKTESENDPFTRMKALKDKGMDSIAAAAHAALDR